MRKTVYGLIQVMKALNDAGSLKFMDQLAGLISILVCKDQFRFAGAVYTVLHISIDITVGMTRHDDGGLPSADIGFDPLDQDRSTENSTVQSRTDRSVGALVHSLQIVFLYTSRIGGNSRALDSDTIFFRGFCSIYCDLVIGLIPLRESEVIILCLEIDVGKKEIILDHFPDDTGHLISIHLYKRSLHHNFAHSPSSLRFIVLSGGPKDRRRLPDIAKCHFKISIQISDIRCRPHLYRYHTGRFSPCFHTHCACAHTPVSQPDPPCLPEWLP